MLPKSIPIAGDVDFESGMLMIVKCQYDMKAINNMRCNVRKNVEDDEYYVNVMFVVCLNMNMNERVCLYVVLRCCV